MHTIQSEYPFSTILIVQWSNRLLKIQLDWRELFNNWTVNKLLKYLHFNYKLWKNLCKFCIVRFIIIFSGINYMKSCRTLFAKHFFCTMSKIYYRTLYSMCTKCVFTWNNCIQFKIIVLALNCVQNKENKLRK